LLNQWLRRLLVDPSHPPNTVELANELARNKPAQADVSGKLADEMPETVTSRPYSGLRQILNSTALRSGGVCADL